jgi:hypothetical protein
MKWGGGKNKERSTEIDKYANYKERGDKGNKEKIENKNQERRQDYKKRGN